MNKFFIYEEYGSKYEILMRDFESANKTLPEWESYQRGFETLASTLGSVKGNDDASKKALTISDLLVKVVYTYTMPFILSVSIQLTISQSLFRESANIPCCLRNY
jgi:hypothetical protein